MTFLQQIPQGQDPYATTSLPYAMHALRANGPTRITGGRTKTVQWSKSLFLVISVLVVAGGCRPLNRTAPVDGQVYVKLKSLDTVKLSAIEVFMVNHAAARRAADGEFKRFGTNYLQDATRFTTLLEESASIRSDINLRSEILGKMPNEIRQARSTIAVYSRSIAPAWVDAVENSKRIIEQHLRDEPMHKSKITQGKARLAEIEQEIDVLKKRLEDDRIFESVAKAVLPFVIDRTSTDIDGRFHFRSAPPTSGILAYERRQIFDGEEELLWLVPITAPKIDLNNLNVYNPDASVSALIKSTASKITQGDAK